MSKSNPITFGLIAEGATDQAVLENILIGYFDDLEGDKIIINPIQPYKGETFGGWVLALDYLKSGKLEQSLAFNDYFIIQIDTDICEELEITPINEKEVNKIIEFTETIKSKIIENYIDEEVYKACSDRLIFAISVHSIECWLLPIYTKGKKKTKIVKCLDVLQKELIIQKSRLNLKNKKARDYDRASSNFYKRKQLKKLYKEHPSFEIFIDNELDVVFGLFKSD